MREAEIDSDLEDGEIKDEIGLEDVSDCSLSDIVTIQEGLYNESDIDQLREEALKSLNEKDESIDEVTEEERYRLEALKSLLNNMEIMEADVSKPRNEPKRRKSKRKHKHPSKYREKKRKKSLVAVQGCDQLELHAEVPKTDDFTACHLNEESKMKEKGCPSRSWYPKCESTLIVIPSRENIDPLSLRVKLERNADFIPLTVKSEEVVPSKSVNSNRVIIARQPVTNGNGFKSFKSVPLTSSSGFRKVSQHRICKISSTLPVTNKFTSQNIKTGKYKLVNRSNYVLRKPSTPKPKEIPIKPPKPNNKYCINRLKCDFPQINPREFIIELDEEDSSKEEDMKDNDCCCSLETVPENCSTVSSTSNVEMELGKSVTKQKQEHNEKARLSDKTDVVSTGENGPISVRCSDSSAQVHAVKKFPVVVLPSVESNTNTDTHPKSVDQSKEKETRVSHLKNGDSLLLAGEASHTTTFRMKKNQNDDELLQMKFDETGMKPLGAKLPSKGEIENEIDTSTKNYSSILVDAEANLIKIREKLVSDLDQLDQVAKQNVLEVEKLHGMLKKLLLLRSMVLKVEGKVKLQKSKLSMNTSCMNSLFSGVSLRTEYCSKLKKVCLRAGRTVIGPSYKPPDDFEDLITEKQKVIDFVKNILTERK